MSTAERRDFIGGVVASILLKKGVEKAIEVGVDKLAANKNVSLEPKDASRAKAVLQHQVEKDITDQVVHKTNSEPAYQSRVAQGSVAAVLMAVATMWQFATDGQVQTPVEWTPPALVVVGAAWALYGRFIAKKAFGA